jgi:hypothetical protein
MKGATGRALLPSTILFLYNFTFPQDTFFACFLLLSGFLLGVLSDPEDGGDMFLRNVG